MRAHPGAHNLGSPRRDGDRAPASIVPFLQAPASRGLSSGSSSGGSRSSRTDGAPAAQRSVARAPPLGALLTELPMLGLRDWELNLNALEVRRQSNLPGHEHKQQACAVEQAAQLNAQKPSMQVLLACTGTAVMSAWIVCRWSWTRVGRRWSWGRARLGW